MLNWIHELEGLQPEIEKEKHLSLSDYRIRQLNRLCGLPLYQVGMIALFCAMRKGKRGLKIHDFCEAARIVMPGKPIVRGAEALIAGNWLSLVSDGPFPGDEYLRLTRPVELALRTSNFDLLPIPKAMDRHWPLRKLYAESVTIRCGLKPSVNWSYSCEDYIRRSDYRTQKEIRAAQLSDTDLYLLMYVAVLGIIEGGELDLRSLLQLFSNDPIERNILRASFMKSTHALKKDNWWKLEESFRGEIYVKPGERVMKLILPEFELKSADKAHPALLTVEHTNIEPVELIVSSKLNEELEVISGLCESSTFERYCASLENQSNKGLIVQLHGEPGTGKTEFCYQLARKTGRNVLMLDVSQVRDKYYGETEKLVTGIFNSYRSIVNADSRFPILLFNEGDSIFQRRIDNEHGSTQTENTIQTILLNELERFQGILLITTNTPNHFDKAFERRFQYRLKFDLPDYETRCTLLQRAFPEVERSMVEQVASSVVFSAADLLNIKRKMQIQSLLGKGKVHGKDGLQMLMEDKVFTGRQAIGY
jgi:hypothetical protein